MFEQTPLARSFVDGDAFALHVLRFPLLACRVDTLLTLAEQVKNAEDATELHQLMTYRDAVHALATIAYTEGFFDTASIFEQSYQTTCLLLLTAWAEGD